MSKKGKSNRQDTKEETLNEKNKILKSENRRLRKEIKELKRQLLMPSDAEEDKCEGKGDEIKKKCSNCGNDLTAFVLDLPFGKRYFDKCDTCGYRKLIKKEGRDDKKTNNNNSFDDS